MLRLVHAVGVVVARGGWQGGGGQYPHCGVPRQGARAGAGTSAGGKRSGGAIGSGDRGIGVGKWHALEQARKAVEKRLVHCLDHSGVRVPPRQPHPWPRCVGPTHCRCRHHQRLDHPGQRQRMLSGGHVTLQGPDRRQGAPACMCVPVSVRPCGRGRTLVMPYASRPMASIAGHTCIAHAAAAPAPVVTTSSPCPAAGSRAAAGGASSACQVGGPAKLSTSSRSRANGHATTRSDPRPHTPFTRHGTPNRVIGSPLTHSLLHPHRQSYRQIHTYTHA
jgi:hypothetical protein